MWKLWPTDCPGPLLVSRLRKAHRLGMIASGAAIRALGACSRHIVAPRCTKAIDSLGCLDTPQTP